MYVNLKSNSCANISMPPNKVTHTETYTVIMDMACHTPANNWIETQPVSTQLVPEGEIF